MIGVVGQDLGEVYLAATILAFCQEIFPAFFLKWLQVNLVLSSQMCKESLLENQWPVETTQYLSACPRVIFCPPSPREQPQYMVKVYQPDSCTVAVLQVGECNRPLVERPSQKVLGRLQAYHATRPRKSAQMNWVIKYQT